MWVAKEAGTYFRFLVACMNDLYLSHALTHSPPFIRQRLDEFSATTECVGDADARSIKFTMLGQEFLITHEVINQALGVTLNEGESFLHAANEVILEEFFKTIGYTGPVLAENSTSWYIVWEMDRKYLWKECIMAFDDITKVFYAKSSGWNGIPEYSKKITYSMVHNYKIHIGSLLHPQFKKVLEKSSSRK